MSVTVSTNKHSLPKRLFINLSLDQSFIFSMLYPQFPNATGNPSMVDVVHQVYCGPRVAPPPPEVREEEGAWV